MLNYLILGFLFAMKHGEIVLYTYYMQIKT